jgi:Thymidylate synthase
MHDHEDAAPGRVPLTLPTQHPAEATRSGGLAFALASPNLAELLGEARALLRRYGSSHSTQRGQTWSANVVALTWQPPHIAEGPALRWARHDVDWYLRVFVNRSRATDPLRTPSPGDLLFPYTYAARSRYWDAGWAYLCAFLATLREHGLALEHARRSRRAFAELLAVAGEHLHLQTLLSLCALYPLELLGHYLAHPELAEASARTWRRDTLRSAIADIAANPHSRRAVVPSFAYPHLEEALSPQMGRPPYQLFQLLPADADAPLDSVHEHRSLDVVGGAQLDFAHDLAWLTLAAQTLRRPIGNITVFAHNLHEYQDQESDGVEAAESAAAQPSIEAWLCFVTDGYHSGHGMARQLLDHPLYRANTARIYATWRRDQR